MRIIENILRTKGIGQKWLVLILWKIYQREQCIDRKYDLEEGAYWQNAAPLNLGHSDGAPCRAVLIRE